MEFRILGPLEVIDGDRRISLPRGRGRALLAVLLLNAGEVVSTERLIDELWGPSPPRTAAKALQGLVSTLRKRLASAVADDAATSVLETRPPGYVLAVVPGQVDANVFRQQVVDAEDAPADEKAVRLRAALALWRGPPLVDFTYEVFAQRAIATFEELRLTTTEARIDADLSLGRHADLVAELEVLVAEHPFRERLRRHLVLALYRSGRQADALACYRDARHALVDELGIEPGPQLRELEEAILRQDPALDVVTAATSLSASASSPADVEVAARSWLTQRRRTVTVVIVDLSESAGSADPEASQPVVRRCYDIARTTLARHGGTVEGLIGGILVAVFGVPAAHEDDALRAVRATVELRDALLAANREFALNRGTGVAARVGVNTGEVVAGVTGASPTAASGRTVNVAARLQQAAADGEVLLGEATRRLVGGAARVEPVDGPAAVGGDQPAVAWRLVGLAPDARAHVPDLNAPMVGRDHELARLRAAFGDTVRAGHPFRFLVLGEAGIGKSRLALEFADTIADGARVLTGHCPAYGEGITFWPLGELVAQAEDDASDGLAAGAREDELLSATAEVAAWISSGGVSQRAEQLLPTVRRWFELLARSRPLVVILEDVHWAQPTFLDLVDHLAESIRVSVFFLCLARPEFFDERRTWAGGGTAAASMVLKPLTPDDSEHMIADRLAGGRLPPRSADQIVELAQGVPLFVEQMLAAWRSGEHVAVPPSIRALLAARLDRLGPAERDLLCCASVVGTQFSVRALTALVPESSRPFVDRHLRELRNRDLVAPCRRPYMGDPTAFAFRHVLIQQTAYATLTHRARAQLHEQVAGWLEHERAPAFEELIGYHLEQAYRQRRRIGPVDERIRQLGVWAGERLASAGLSAAGRFDAAAAENLLGRARMLLPAGHPQRQVVLRRLAESCQVRGRLAETDAVLTEMLDVASGDDHAMRRTRVEQLRIRMISGPDPMPMDAIRTEAEQALVEFTQSADDVGMSQASYVLAFAHLRAGRMRDLENVARRGLAHAERSGDVREQIGALWWVSLALVSGPTPVPEAIRSCEELLRSRRTEHAGVLSDLGRLRAMVGEFEAARELIARARRDLTERLHVRRALTFLAHHGAMVEVMAGDLAAAERMLRPALELAHDIEESDQISQLAATLSRVLSGRGEVAEGARFAAIGRHHAPSESVTAQVLWRVATARTVLPEEPREAEHLAREAVEFVPEQMLNLRADLHVELATTLLATGRPEAALWAQRQAAELYERKRNLVGAQRANALRM